MGGLLKTLFGFGKKKAGAATTEAAGSETHVPAAVRTQRLAPIGQDEFTVGDDRQRTEQEQGPWHIGKTVAEIFEIRSVLGRGGMGIVYRAYDTATMKDVAVKVPLGKFVDDPIARKSFTQEAEHWTALVHPHIVHAFDVHDDKTTDYRPAIFMDNCDGGSLASRICGGCRLPLRDALDIAIQICWAMEFAHEKGMIHRDLKPENVLLNTDGAALVTDFGLVMSREAAGGEVGAAGTPAYMPPEQWRGQPCKQSDIYGFGVMLYELFCGCLPFTAESPAAFRVPHERIPPPAPRQLDAEIPESLAELMLACLAKTLADRPVDFGNVSAQLCEAYEVVTGRKHSSHRVRPAVEEISRAEKQEQAWRLIRMGAGCKLRGDMEETQRLYGKAHSIFEVLGDNAGIGTSYMNMGAFAATRGNCTEAMELFQKSLSTSQTLGDDAAMGMCYSNMAEVAENRGNYDEALELLQKALLIFEALGDQCRVANCCGNMGCVAMARGNNDEAMELFQKSLSTSQALDDKVGMGDCYSNMGAVADARGNYDDAMQLYREALLIREALGDKTGTCICHANMARVALARGNNDEAAAMYHKSLAIGEELGATQRMAQCYHDLGTIHFEHGEHDAAVAMYRKALALDETEGRRPRMSKTYLALAEVHRARSESDAAVAMYRKALVIAEGLGNRKVMSLCYFLLADVYNEQGKYEQVVVMCNKLVPLAERVKDQERLAICYERLGRAYCMRGECDKALEILRKSVVVHEKLGDQTGVYRCHMNLGIVYEQYLHRPREALKMYEEALRLARELSLPLPEGLEVTIKNLRTLVA